LVAGGATLLAALPLSTIFEQWTWLVQCLIVVALIEGAAILARTLRAPAWAQLVSMGGALLVVLTFLTEDNKAILGLIPTTETFTRFGELLGAAGTAMREMGVPVADDKGLLFLTALGVGGVAICVDVCAVMLRRPALAGLPMLAIYSVPVAVQQDSVSAIPFVAGAAGFLWLLVIDNVDRVRRFGRRFTGDGRDIDVWEPSPLAAAGRRLAIVGVLVAVALPLAVPGMTTGLLDRFGTGGEGPGNGIGSGRGRQVNLWALLEGTLKQTEQSDMVRVTTDDPAPGYLRFGTADDLRLEGFRNRNPGGTRSARSLPDPSDQDRPGVYTYEGRAQVDIVNLNMNLLPVYADPTAFTSGDIAATWFYDENQNVIFSNRVTTAGKKYTFNYVRSDYDPTALRAAKPVPATDQIRLRYTQVPGGVPEVTDLVNTLTMGKTNDYDKVLALYNYFSTKNGFEYNLNSDAETSAPAIVDFLTVRKSGYCVQYAAALAWMVREAGIPARVGFGFTRGSRQGNTYTLTNQNLHAWTEVYFAGYGWLPFDATPSTFITGSVNPGWAPDPDAPTQEGPGADPTPGTGGAPGENPDDPGDGNTPDLGESDPGAGGIITPQGPQWPGYLGLGLLVALLLLAVPAARRALLRRGRRPRAVPAAAGAAMSAGGSAGTGPRMVVVGDLEQARRDAHAAWDELIDTLIDFRLPVDLAETPRTTADRVVRDAALRDAAAKGALLLGRAEERARYARAPLATDQLGSSLRAVRRAFAQRASRRTRFMAAVLPRSVLQRWRLAVVSATAGTVTAAARVRDAVVRTLSPRRLISFREAR
jgi:hypothetical protein